MVTDNRFARWKDDGLLRAAMQDYVKQGLKREETINFLQGDFQQYQWSMQTLDRCMRHFCIYYIDKDVSIEVVKEAVQEELAGPGKPLGYRAMQKKIRINHGLYVGRDKVYDMMIDLDQEGLAARGGVGKKIHKRKGNFTSLGPNWVHSLDGHDKLMGFQNSTFPIAVYGCLDTASRKLLWLRVWMSNHNPQLITLVLGVSYGD